MAALSETAMSAILRRVGWNPLMGRPNRTRVPA
jgi:hypothetical protein